MTDLPARRAALYQRIGDVLLERIRDGSYPVGSKLPTDAQLSEEFRVGRHTAREAIRKLVDLGLVERRRRVGTTVVRQHPTPQFGLALDTTDQLRRYLEFTDLHVHRRIATLPRQPAEIELEGRLEDWFKIETYRTIPGGKRAVSWTDIYLRIEYASVADKIGVRQGGVYPLLEDDCGEIVEHIEMEISAARFPRHVADFLGYADTDPALQMVRSFRNPVNKLMEVAVSFYPPYEFRYVTRLSRQDGRHAAAT